MLPQEARELVRPRLGEEKARLSDTFAAQGVPTRDGRPGPPYCFLVSTDLTRIDPHPAVYPWSGQWNGESPFLEVGGERRMRSLEAAARVPIPSAESEAGP